MMSRIGKKKIAGVTLIEVLVTVIVLAFGLLGLAGLQANSLRNNHSAFIRSQATYLAYEILDRMRANRVEAINNGNYNIDLGDTPTGTTAAKKDLISWKAALANTLPSGDGQVDCDTDTNVCSVQVEWTDNRKVGATELKVQMSAEL